MKLVVCFISPRQRLGDIKHTTRFIIHRMEWKFIWDPICIVVSITQMGLQFWFWGLMLWGICPIRTALFRSSAFLYVLVHASVMYLVTTVFSDHLNFIPTLLNQDERRNKLDLWPRILFPTSSVNWLYTYKWRWGASPRCFLKFSVILLHCCDHFSGSYTCWNLVSFYGTQFFWPFQPK